MAAALTADRSRNSCARCAPRRKNYEPARAAVVSSLPMAVVVVASWLLRLALGGVLIVAGVLKLHDPVAFATEVANYHLLPSLAPFVAATLPCVEILVGAGLVLFPIGWRRPATVAALLLMVMFAVAVSAAYLRHVNVSCGCFGEGGGPINGLTVLRDLALVAAAAALLALDRPDRAGRTSRPSPLGSTP
jgi:hypothetical protein